MTPQKLAEVVTVHAHLACGTGHGAESLDDCCDVPFLPLFDEPVLCNAKGNAWIEISIGEALPHGLCTERIIVVTWVPKEHRAFYGAAELTGLTVSERAHLLVEIAHPDFRDDLRKVAAELGRA